MPVRFSLDHTRVLHAGCAGPAAAAPCRLARSCANRQLGRTQLGTTQLGKTQLGSMAADAFDGVLHLVGVGQLQGLKRVAFTATTQLDTFCSTIAKQFGVHEPSQLIVYGTVTAVYGRDLKQAPLPQEDDCVALAVEDVWQGVTAYLRDRQPSHLPFKGDVICVDAATSAAVAGKSSQGDAVRVQAKRRNEADASSSGQVQHVNLRFNATHFSCLD